MRCIPKPRAVLEHPNPRRGEKSHLGSKLARLLAAISNSFASLRSKNTTASPTAMPFFVPPKQRTSTPACHVISFGAQPRDARRWQNARHPCACATRATWLSPTPLSSRRRVNRSEFRRLCEADDARFRKMNVRAFLHHLLDRSGVILPSDRDQQLRSIGKELRRAAFVGFDVRECTKNAVVTLAQRGE